MFVKYKRADSLDENLNFRNKRKNPRNFHMISKFKMKTKSLHRAAAGLALLAAGALLLAAAANFPDFAEWYAVRVYPLLVSSVGRLTGLLPFSLVEILLYFLILLLLLTLIRTIARTLRERGPGPALSWASGLLLGAGILLFLYAVGCGVNYRRDSFTEEEGITTAEFSADDLAAVCTWLTEEVNALSDTVTRDAEGIMTPDRDAGQAAVAAMKGLAETYPSLSGFYPQPKRVLCSEILSVQSVTGVYSPFTIEANYNGDMTGYDIPFTMCHELSHLRGFMEEKEANYIAFLACIGSERDDFRYSGYLSGWVYCMNTLYKTDRETWRAIRSELAETADADLAANSAFWEQYEGTVSEVQSSVNDSYLKASGQSEGVAGYDRIVDLIVTYFLTADE